LVNRHGTLFWEET